MHLVELATHRAIVDALVVTGDSDLAIGIELAQRRGVRIAVLGVQDMTPGNSVYPGQSPEITSLADRNVLIGKTELSSCLAYVPVTPTTQTITSTTSVSALEQGQGIQNNSETKTASQLNVAVSQNDIDKAVAEFLSKQSPQLTKSVISPNNSIDKEVDKSLLFYILASLKHGKLSEDEKRASRESFRKQLTSS